jgi:antitoxin MazE
MKVELIRIGNSRGVRIPKSVIDQCGFDGCIELQVDNGRVILARARQPREGWKEALDAAKDSISGDELLLDGIPEHEFNHNEWTW